MDFDIQDEIRGARAAGFSDSEIEYFLELTAGERERIEAGDLSAWVGKDSPDYRRRLGARARTMGQAKTRQMQEAQDQAERLGRLQALLERPGITEDMTIEEAIAAGIVTEEEVDQAFNPSAVGLASDVAIDKTALPVGLPYDVVDAERVMRDAGFRFYQRLAASEQALTASYVILDHMQRADRDTLPPNTMGAANTLWRLFRTVAMANSLEYEEIVDDDRETTLADAMVLLLKKNILFAEELPRLGEALRAIGLPEMAHVVEQAKEPNA